MSVLIKTLTRMGLLKDDLDYHFIACVNSFEHEATSA
jgi:hypothetical protein